MNWLYYLAHRVLVLTALVFTVLTLSRLPLLTADNPSMPTWASWADPAWWPALAAVSIVLLACLWVCVVMAGRSLRRPS